MCLPSHVISVENLSEAIAGTVIADALKELRIKNILSKTKMETKINGKLHYTPNAEDIKNFKKLMESEENLKNTDYNNVLGGLSEPVNGVSASYDNRALQTIEENDTSSITSDDDSLTSSDSSEPEIVTFVVDSAPKSSPEPTTKLLNGNRPKTARKNDHKPNQEETKITSNIVDSQPLHGGVKLQNPTNEKLPSSDKSVLINSLEGSSSGSSDVVFKTKEETNTDLGGKKDFNDSGTLSEGSDSNDHKDMLAELQRIVEEDKKNKETSLEETDALPLQNSPPEQDSERPSEQGGVLRNSVSDSYFGDPEGENKHGDGDNINGDSNHSNGHHDNTPIDTPSIIQHEDHAAKLAGQRDKEKENETVRESSSKTQVFPNSGKAITEDTPSSLCSKESFENIEKKLVQLEKSTTDQTEEIKRIKDVNESLKSKFNELKMTSSHHHQLESQMSKKNEELEKHLLGVLKSQEIIYDMKEKMSAVTATNEKLTKDYQDAVTALEAVDKLFNQKDELVQKWKESTEESRKLVELLKKHNAEVEDLETVDKLKEEIADLQKPLSKAEETIKCNAKKNEELVEQSKLWKKKFEYENEQGIKLNYQIQEVTKEAKSHQKLAAKRGRKNQMLHVELTELKDMLKLAKEKMVQSELKMKELEDKNTNSQEMYTSIIHEKEKQHSALIKTSETSQKESVSRAEVVDKLREEIDALKTSIHDLENGKTRTEEKLTNSQKTLEDALEKQAELNTEIQTIQAELEQCKIEKIDYELYVEEQSVHIEGLEEQCRELQQIVKQFIHKTTHRHKRSRSHGKLRAQSMPSHTGLDMYRQLLLPPKPMRRRPHTSLIRRPSSFPNTCMKKTEDLVDGIVQPSPPPPGTQPSRPKSTYGNRQLSSSQKLQYYHVESTKDYAPKSPLLDNKKQDSECESGSVSADQYAMEHVKVGDRVLIEMAVEGSNQNLPSVVKYIGPVYHKNFKTGIYAGLKLDIPVGDTNGALGGRVYFRCLNKYGKFIQLSHILAIQNQRTQQYTRILPISYKL